MNYSEWIESISYFLTDNWNWVTEWCEMLPAHAMAALLDRCFFPKWLQTLNVWLKMNPNFDEVNRWFTGWKTRIPDYIKSDKLYTGEDSVVHIGLSMYFVVCL